MREIELVIRTEGAEGHTERRSLRPGDAPVTIGRDPSLAIAVSDKRVSWSHARIWANEDGVWVRDMGSRNGTGVAGRRIEGTVKAELGDEVNVAGVLMIRLEGTETPTEIPTESWFLDDLRSGRRFPIPGDRFSLVSDEPGRPTLTLTRKGDAWWLHGGALAIPVEPGHPFEVAGRTLCLGSTSTGDTGTVGIDTQVEPGTEA